MASSGTFGNLVGAFRPAEKAGVSNVSCSCPACTGLQCLERPRFFAGQLLSEADFNSEIDYMLAKQRLHNRYLHGVGTVCGLEVVCSGCDGQVIIQPGYAIDPCGNDIIVCQQQQFDVLKAIKACCDARKKKSKTGCDPFQPPSDPGCANTVQNWCITIQYQETMTQPITPLRGLQKTCSCNTCSSTCGCGCGNGSGMMQSNGCSGNGSSTSTSSSSPTTATVSCEPTRVLESYQLGVVEDPGNCTEFPTLLQNTLLSNLAECIAPVFQLLDKNNNVNNVLTASLAGTLPTSQILNSDAFTACCQLRQLAIDLFTNSTTTTRCNPLNNLSTCPQPPQNNPNNPGGVTGGGSDPQYLTQVQTAVVSIWNVLVAYMVECACYQLLPPCPPDPGDDRLVLACLTIRNGVITNVCNFGCRKFAGGFPSFFYWLSLIPIIPALKRLVTELCCGTTEGTITGIGSSNRFAFNAAANVGPTGSVQRAFTEGNFALPRAFFARVGDLSQKLSLQGLASSIPVGGLNLATVQGMSLQNAQNSLNSFGVTYEVRQVNSSANVPLSPGGLSSPLDLVAPFAQSGDHVVIYQIQSTGAVAAVQRANVAQTQSVLDLQKQVATMKADIEVLKKVNLPKS
jgi:hypothetical protein